MAARKVRGIIGYRSYMFKTKDPVIDEFRTVVQMKLGTITTKNLKKIEAAGGPKVQTMKGWLFKDTNRPSNATAEAALRAIGVKRICVDMAGNNAPVLLNRRKRNG